MCRRGLGAELHEGLGGPVFPAFIFHKKKKNTPISTLCIKVSGGNLRSIKIKYILQYIDSLLSCSSFGIL
jgi:hypothetical protein